MHIHLPPLLRAILDLETPFSVRDPTFAADLAEKASGNLSVSRENAKCVMDLVRKKTMPELVRAQMPTAAALQLQLQRHQQRGATPASLRAGAGSV